MGTTGLTAQAFGRGDGDELRAGLGRALLLALADRRRACCSPAPASSAAALALFEPSARVAAELETYLAIRLLGAPAALGQPGPARLAARHAERARADGAADRDQRRQHRARSPGSCSASAGASRASPRPRSAPSTAAWRSASGWSRGACARVPAPGAGRRSRARAAFGRLLAVNRDIMLRSLSLEAAFLTFTALSSRQGEIVLAANAVLLNFLTFAAFGLDGFAHAAEAMVGRHVGAGSRAGFRAATRANLGFALGAGPGDGARSSCSAAGRRSAHDRARDGARRGARLPALRRRAAAGRGLRLPVRRRLHRRDPHRRRCATAWCWRWRSSCSPPGALEPVRSATTACGSRCSPSWRRAASGSAWSTSTSSAAPGFVAAAVARERPARLTDRAGDLSLAMRRSATADLRRCAGASLARSLSACPRPAGSDRRLRRHAAPLRELRAARAGARAREADPRLPAARLRLRAAAALPGVLLQRRSRPLRLEPVRGRPRPGARGRDRAARGVVRQLAPRGSARPGDRGRAAAAADRGRHRLRRRHAQPRSGPGSLGRLGGGARRGLWRLRRRRRWSRRSTRATAPSPTRRCRGIGGASLGGVSALADRPRPRPALRPRDGASRRCWASRRSRAPWRPPGRAPTRSGQPPSCSTSTTTRSALPIAPGFAPCSAARRTGRATGDPAADPGRPPRDRVLGRTRAAGAAPADPRALSRLSLPALPEPRSTPLMPGSGAPKSLRRLERVKGIEPSTRSLGSFCSTTELHPRRPHF